MKKKKQEVILTEAELKKMQDEFYSLGFKHGVQKKNPMGTPAARTNLEMDFAVMQKSIGDNARKISSQILDYHDQVVKKHMEEYQKDSEKALEELLKLAEKEK